MQLQLTNLPSDQVKGIYDGRLAARMLFLHPSAAQAFRGISDLVIVSDMFRSAASSLKAIQTRKGAAAPARSGHNYGFSIDVDVGPSMKLTKCKTKKEFDQWMAARHWHCHRTDHVQGHESWHYNFFDDAEAAQWLTPDLRYTSGALEAKILAHYGEAFTMEPVAIQSALADLRLYDGALDGNLGEVTSHAIKLFQRTWGLSQDGKAGPITQRTLAYVTAVVKLHEI